MNTVGGNDQIFGDSVAIGQRDRARLTVHAGNLAGQADGHSGLHGQILEPRMQIHAVQKIPRSTKTISIIVVSSLVKGLQRLSRNDPTVGDEDGTGFYEIKPPILEDARSIGADMDGSTDFVGESRLFKDLGE